MGEVGFLFRFLLIIRELAWTGTEFWHFLFLFAVVIITKGYVHICQGLDKHIFQHCEVGTLKGFTYFI